MDAVILAAGRGTRMHSIVGAGSKVLVPIDGIPLIERLVIQARRYCKNVTVVVSPSNAADVDEALDAHDVNLVIQRRPFGPGDALRVGLRQSTQSVEYDDHTLVMLGDNIMTDHQLVRFMNGISRTLGSTGIACRRIDCDDAGRYTWFHPNEKIWIERDQVLLDDVASSFSHVDCWIGPFVGSRKTMLPVLNFALPTRGTGEVPIGPLLGDLIPGTPIIYADAYDLGTPEAYLRYLLEKKTND